MSDDQPTDQIPVLQQPKRSRYSALTRKPVLLAAGAVAIAVVASGVTWAVTSHDSENSTAGKSTAEASSTRPEHSNDRQAKPRPIVGTIATENGGTWTITGRDGQALSVTISPATKFGSTRMPEQQSQFAVGDTVLVRGTVQNDQVAATQIIERTGSKTSSPH